MQQSLYHVTKKENLDSIMEHGLFPSTGKNSRELGDFGIFFFKDLDALEDAVSTWFGDLFEDDDELVILQVEVPENIKVFHDELVGYECFVEDCISSEYITLYENPKYTL